MASKTRNKGFSLLELLIVATVILTMTGLAISNYSSFTDTQKIKQAGRTLKNNLRFIQTRAASGLKPSTCDAANPLVSYRVTFAASNYQNQAVCSSGLSGTVTTVNLPSGLTFSPVPSFIEFGVLNGTVTSAAAFPVSLTITNGTKRYVISVSGNGDLNDLGFQ